MKALFNDNIIDNNLTIELNNRALQFGDGLFETIITHKTKVQLLNLHFDRLMNGGRVLSLNVNLTLSELEHKIISVIEANGVETYNRIKLIVWRGNEAQKGYYSGSNQAEILITSKPSVKPEIRIIEKASFSKNVRLIHHSFSALKTLSALPYVMASHEREKRAFDELILCDGQGNISECVSSNIFWIDGNHIYTTSLDTGCVAGVMRQHIIKQLAEQGISVKKVVIQKDQFLKAEFIFSTNVAGVGIIKSIDDQSYETENELFDKIKRLLVL